MKGKTPTKTSSDVTDIAAELQCLDAWCSQVSDVHGSLLFSQLKSRDSALAPESYHKGEKWDIESMRSDIALYNMGFTSEAIAAQKSQEHEK